MSAGNAETDTAFLSLDVTREPAAQKLLAVTLRTLAEGKVERQKH